MNINWNAIIEGTSGGIAASIILGLLVILRGYVREGLLRYRLKRDFRHLSYGESVAGATLGVRNHVGRPFIVRSIAIQTDQASYRLNHTGEVRTDFKGKYPKISRREARWMREGKISAIGLGTEIQHRSWHSPPTSEGFTVMEPYTWREFLLPNALIPAVKGRVLGILAIVEYTNWSGMVKIMKIDVRDEAHQVQLTIDNLKSEIESGASESVRQKFKRPPAQRFSFHQAEPASTPPNETMS